MTQMWCLLLLEEQTNKSGSQTLPSNQHEISSQLAHHRSSKLKWQFYAAETCTLSVCNSTQVEHDLTTEDKVHVKCLTSVKQ